jgi:hypothetical protein
MKPHIRHHGPHHEHFEEPDHTEIMEALQVIMKRLTKIEARLE